MPLPDDDLQYLADAGHEYELLEVDKSGTGEMHLVLRRFVLPAGYSAEQTDVLIRLPAHYPATGPDMYWTRETIMLASGAFPENANVFEDLPTGRWQRWSRHRNCAWRPYVDNMEGYIRSVVQDLKRVR
jgi:Prokaryotic E2 family E